MGSQVYIEQHYAIWKTHLHPGWDSNPCLILHRHDTSVISALIPEGKSF